MAALVLNDGSNHSGAIRPFILPGMRLTLKALTIPLLPISHPRNPLVSTSHLTQLLFQLLAEIHEFLSSKDLKASFNHQLPDEYNEILVAISRTGDVKHDWELLKKVFALKIIQVLKAYFAERGFLGLVEHTFEGRCGDLLALLQRFEDSPFTVQRLAEVLTDPSQYQSTHKLMNCLEKLLSVTLTMPSRA